MAETTNGDGTRSRFPPGRYGRRRSPRRAARWRPTLLLVIGTLIGLGVALLLFGRYGDADYQPRVRAFTIADDRATVRFDVRKPPNAPAVCLVRARNRVGAEVGSAQVTVPAGVTEMTYELATSDRPVSAEVPSCRPADR